MEKTAALCLLLIAAVACSGWRFYELLKPMRSARSDARFDHPVERLRGVARAVGLHERLLKLRYSGVLHALILGSFLILVSAIVEDFGSVLFPGFSLRPIGGDSWIALLQDLFALVMLAGVALAAWQRYVIRPPRFRGSNQIDASIIYVLIVAIVGGMVLEASFAILAGSSTSAAWRPLSGVIARLLHLSGISSESARTGQHVAYWAHVGFILLFLVYIPGSKHRHMFLAAPNIYFRSLDPKGLLPRGAPDIPPPIAKTEDLTWKDMLDVYSCTECGRCQAACPAHAAGLPLSPKLLITDIRDLLIDRAASGGTKPLVGGAISAETLWACTTCRACMQTCPVHIEHIPKIVGMRRQLVEEGKLQPMLQDALSNLQRTGNSMGSAARMRARWTKDVPFKIKDARKEPVDILWFVGDFASYDPRVQNVTKKIAALLHKAGVDFGILYDSERNSGNDVHRVGEEGLYELLARHNIDALASCSFKRIMTTDPHSFNALACEYPTFGVEYKVVHYSTLLLELIDAGRLIMGEQTGETVTYHDPCYLGRYNDGFEAPRAIIERAGYRLHEMGRCRENSFCCGAGGGRIWADDTGIVERPSENRIKEALALGDARYFVVACPKDKVMYTAAAQALGVEDRIEVVDLVELLMSDGSGKQAQLSGVSATVR